MGSRGTCFCAFAILLALKTLIKEKKHESLLRFRGQSMNHGPWIHSPCPCLHLMHSSLFFLLFLQKHSLQIIYTPFFTSHVMKITQNLIKFYPLYHKELCCKLIYKRRYESFNLY